MLLLELFTRIHNNRSSTMISNFRYCASWLEFGGLTSSMSKNRDTVVTVGFGQGSKVDSVPMDSQMTHIPEALTGQRGPGKPQSSGPRHGRLMHQSTLSLGDPQGSGTSYTTTHTQSYCGREADGQPLVFFLRDPAYPSQHTSQLDLSHTSTSQLQTHSRDIHNTKDIIPFNVLHKLGQSNWSRNREGVAMREVTNPKEPTPYWTTYRSEHRSPSPSPSPHDPTGRPTLWHQHDILTGETRTPAGPGNARRQSGERVLWATRRWETDCCSFRLY